MGVNETGDLIGERCQPFAGFAPSHRRRHVAHMLANEAMQTRLTQGARLLGVARQQPTSLEQLQQNAPLIAVAGLDLVGGEIREFGGDQHPQPIQHHAFRWEMRRKFERAPSGVGQGIQGILDDPADTARAALSPDFSADGLGQIVEPSHAFSGHPRQQPLISRCSRRGEIGADQLDAERHARKRAHDFPSGALRLWAVEIAIGSKQRERILRWQIVDRDRLHRLCRADLAWIEAGGDDDLQPLLRRAQRGERGGRQQVRLIDIVEDQKHARLDRRRMFGAAELSALSAKALNLRNALICKGAQMAQMQCDLTVFR